MDKQSKLKQALQLKEAIQTNSESFVLMAKLDKIEDDISKIKMAEPKDEEIIVELSIE